MPDEIARLQERVAALERALRTRLAELAGAEHHIARLEVKLLDLKEAKQQLRQLRQKKQHRLSRKLFRKFRPAPVDAASEYQAWLERHRATAPQLAQMRADARNFREAPLISILTPVFNTPVAWLTAAVQSVLAQAYEKWELILLDDASTDAATVAALAQLAMRDPRIRLVRRMQNGGISAASNEGLAAATGEWIGLLDHDDLLEPDALFQTARLLQTEPAADLIYSDEDKLTAHGFDAPFFKPDWSPDFFLSYNYLCHFVALRRSLVQEVGGFRSAFDGAQDYDLLLRVIEKTERIYHIPRVLYHWRRTSTSTADNIRRKPKALEAGRQAIGEHLQRLGQAGHVAVDWRTHAYVVRRELSAPRRIAIIIPVIDGSPPRCLESLERLTSYSDYEIALVPNGSVAKTDCPWLLFLSSETEVIESEWLTVMAEHVQRPEVGAVGARLLAPDGGVRQAGLVLGVDGIAQSAFRGCGGEEPGVCRQLQVTRNYSAVSGACLLTRRKVFAEVGGFDAERLPGTFNDIDLCLKMRQAGYLVVSTPFARLLHHESASPRPSVAETEVLRKCWPDVLARDPYYNPNLSRAAADFSLGE